MVGEVVEYKPVVVPFLVGQYDPCVLDLSRRPEDLHAWRLAAFTVDKKLLLACSSALVVSNHEELLGRDELPVSVMSL